MNAKILIVALCAFQLASGDVLTGTINNFVSTFINPFFDYLISGISSGQILLISTIQQFDGNYTAAKQSIQTTTQNALNSIQQAAAAANASSAQVKGCVDQANQNLSALSSSAQQQLQLQGASANASIQAASQSLANAASTFQAALNSTVTNFTTCIQQGGVFFIPFNAASCSLQIGTTAIQAVASQVLSGIQTATQLASQVLNLSVNSASQSVIPLVSGTTQAVLETAQVYKTQADGVLSQATSCLSQAANTTASG